jgi:hypothetical protein
LQSAHNVGDVALVLEIVALIRVENIFFMGKKISINLLAQQDRWQ